MTYVAEDEFERDTDYIQTRITADGRDGHAVAPGRYRLIAARACPWANRSIIVRRLLGLEDALSMGLASPTHGEESWNFGLDPDGRDPVLGIGLLRDAYLARDPAYDKGIAIPAIVEIATGAVVTNDVPRITLDLSTEWREHHRPGAPDLYPEALRDEIDEVNEAVFRDVFGDTVDFNQIKAHYFRVQTDINPTGIVPAGPARAGWITPHGREQMGGRPLGDGTPPGAPRDDEKVAAADNPLALVA